MWLDVDKEIQLISMNFIDGDIHGMSCEKYLVFLKQYSMMSVLPSMHCWCEGDMRADNMELASGTHMWD